MNRPALTALLGISLVVSAALLTDPGETRNVASSNPELVTELTGKLDDWKRSTGALPPAKNPAFEGDFKKW